MSISTAWARRTSTRWRNGALSALVANDIISGGKYDIIYDGTQFQIKGLSEGPYNSGALVLLGTFTASSSATINVTGQISSTYDDYLIILENILPATNNATLELLVSTNNGSSWNTGANYNINNAHLSGGTFSYNQGNGGHYADFADTINNAYTSGVSGSLYLHNANDTGGSQTFTGASSTTPQTLTTSQ